MGTEDFMALVVFKGKYIMACIFLKKKKQFKQMSLQKVKKNQCNLKIKSRFWPASTQTR